MILARAHVNAHGFGTNVGNMTAKAKNCRFHRASVLSLARTARGERKIRGFASARLRVGAVSAKSLDWSERCAHDIVHGMGGGWAALKARHQLITKKSQYITLIGKNRCSLVRAKPLLQSTAYWS